MAARRPDRHLPDRTPVLPLPAGPVTNGELVPAPATRWHRAVDRLVLDLADDAAGRAGIDRRRFLRAAGGVAATLAALELASCSSGRSAARAKQSGGSGASGGTFSVPPASDGAACEATLGNRGEFVFDVHTHHVMPDGPWRQNAPDTVQLVLGMVPPECSAANPLECVNRAAYVHDVFLASDTTVALLSDVPSTGPDDAPIPFSDAIGTQDLVAQLAHGGAPRLLLHDVIAPNFGDLRARLDGMTQAAATKHVAGFKVYTAWGPGGHGFALDDPAIGLPVVQQAHDLGVRVLFAHKGLPLVRFDPAHNGPADLVAVSRQFPDMDFVVFHGAWDANHREGPYDRNAAVGIDTLLRALDDHHVPVNDNVWVDVGSVWRQLLVDPDQAAHALGKLLSRVGEQRVLWGTDAIWYGSPQPQIMAFRAFQITNEYQDRFGYPALTDDVKRDVLGLNAARLFGLDPQATRCALASDPLTDAKPAAAQLHDDEVLPSAWQPRGPTTRREMLSWLASSPWSAV